MTFSSLPPDVTSRFSQFFGSRRSRLFFSHLAISAVAVGAVVIIVLFVWYPGALTSLQGALLILALLTGVDVIVGPLLTLIIASPKKSRRELTRDLSIIGIVQLAALFYGVHSLFVARPAYIVFAADRFDVVAANELIHGDRFPYRASRFKAAPLFGPEWAIARPPDGLKERNELLMEAVLGQPDIKQYPALFEPWPPARDKVADSRLKPLAELTKLSEAGAELVRESTKRSGLAETELSYVPLVGREKIGVVILNSKTLEVVLSRDVTPNY